MFKVPKYLLLAYLFIPFLVINLVINTDQQFTLLAHSFLKGNLDLDFAKYTANDLSFYNGKYYFPLGPFPAFLLVPFVFIFGTSFLQGFIQFPLNILNFALTYKISRKLRLSENKSWLLSLFFVFGSIYSPVAAIPSSWYFAQILTTTFLLLSLYEFMGKSRYLVIGILIGLAVLTRLSLIGTGIFFLIFILKEPNKINNLLKFLFPIIVTILLITSYNFVRFGDFLENGYQYQIVQEELKQQKALGLFSLRHVPINIYNMLFRPPKLVISEGMLKPPFIVFDNWGLSIFILSPLLFLVFKAKFTDPLVKTSAITIVLVSVPILAYYGIGWRQIGYRYALDFFPFVLLILISVVKKIDETILKILIFSGVLITWFFIFEKLSGF